MGISFNAKCPSISHLLFVDDSIIFCKADVQQAEIIKKVLRDYTFVSGQEINFQTNLLFSLMNLSLLICKTLYPQFLGLHPLKIVVSI